MTKRGIPVGFNLYLQTNKDMEKEREAMFLDAIRKRGYIIVVIWLAFLFAAAAHLPLEWAQFIFMWGTIISVAVAIKIKILF